MNHVASRAAWSQPAVLKSLLMLSALEGGLVAYLFFREPSMARNAWLLGLSPQRLLTGAMILLPLVGLLVLTVRVFHSPQWLETLAQRQDAILSQTGRLLGLTVTLAYALLVGLAGLALGQVFLPQFPYTYSILWTRLLPLGIWMLAGVAQALVGLAIRYAPLYREKGFFKISAIAQVLLPLLILSTTLFHWAVLVLQLHVFKSIPGWYWTIQAKGFSPRDLLFLILAGAVLVLVYLVLSRPASLKPAWALAGLLLLGWSLQLSTGFMDGLGLESLRLRYADSYHVTYVSNAANEHAGLIDAARNFEQKYGLEIFLGTKPPGMFLVYLAFDRLFHPLLPLLPGADTTARMTWLLAVILPPLSFLILGLIYRFGRRFTLQENALLPAALYITCPNVVLFALFFDQAFYPLVFLGGAALVIWALRGHHPWRWLLAGVFIYLAMFLVFSMAALLAFTLALLGLDFLFDRQRDLRGRLRHASAVALALLAGLLLAWTLGWVGLRYDFFTRYHGAMETVEYTDYQIRDGGIMPRPGESALSLRLRRTTAAAFLNNIDFAAAVGFPVYWLFIAGAVQVVVSLFRCPEDHRARVLAALLATFIGLNLFGQMRGEAARLWLFWAPVFVLFAGTTLQSLYHRARPLALAVIAMQLITLFLTFKFQDLLM